MRISKRGFTLIELMVVVAIIAVLATLVIVDTKQSRAKARDVNRKQSVSAISLALEQRFSNTKSYFVDMPNGNCTAIDPNASQYTSGSTQNFYLAANDTSNTSCVGYQGGGEGRVNAKQNAPVNPGGYKWYPNASDSIDDALYQGGYLATIPIDPSDTSFDQVVNGPDFLLTLCDASGKPAADSASAVNYGVYAQLELPNTLGTSELDTTDHSCGAVDSQYPWDISTYP